MCFLIEKKLWYMMMHGILLRLVFHEDAFPKVGFHPPAHISHAPKRGGALGETFSHVPLLGKYGEMQGEMFPQCGVHVPKRGGFWASSPLHFTHPSN